MQRMVMEQNGSEHVSTVVLADEEVSEHLKAEASLHLMGGWKVTLFGEGEQELAPDPLFHGGTVTSVVMVSPRGVVRRCWGRSYDPSKDGEEGTL
jgi:hypothetical protein